jgi:hypothetical protein
MSLHLSQKVKTPAVVMPPPERPACQGCRCVSPLGSDVTPNDRMAFGATWLHLGGCSRWRFAFPVSMPVSPGCHGLRPSLPPSHTSRWPRKRHSGYPVSPLGIPAFSPPSVVGHSKAKFAGGRISRCLSVPLPPRRPLSPCGEARHVSCAGRRRGGKWSCGPCTDLGPARCHAGQAAGGCRCRAVPGCRPWRGVPAPGPSLAFPHPVHAAGERW